MDDGGTRSEVLRLASRAALDEAATQRFVAAAVDAVVARGRFDVALSGGSTPLGLYRRLATPPWRERVPWRRTHVWWGDERAVRPDDPDSNFGRAREALLAHVPLPAENVHRMRGEDRPLDAAARAYEAALRGALVDAAGALDLVLLGMGGDGHTASLFPGAAALAERERWVVAASAPAGVTPAERLTLTFPALNAARGVLFLVAGVDKAAVLEAVLDDPAAGDRYPAARVRPRGSLTWLVAP